MAVKTEKPNPALQLAEKQRYESLRNAYKTIKAFAVASCSPDQFREFERTERYLKNMYKPKREPKIEIPEGGFRSPKVHVKYIPTKNGKPVKFKKCKKRQ